MISSFGEVHVSPEHRMLTRCEARKASWRCQTPPFFCVNQLTALCAESARMALGAIFKRHPPLASLLPRLWKSAGLVEHLRCCELGRQSAAPRASSLVIPFVQGHVMRIWRFCVLHQNGDCLNIFDSSSRKVTRQTWRRRAWCDVVCRYLLIGPER